MKRRKRKLTTAKAIENLHNELMNNHQILLHRIGNVQIQIDGMRNHVADIAEGVGFTELAFKLLRKERRRLERAHS